MLMDDYLEQIRYSINGLMPLLWHEHDQEGRLHQSLNQLEQATSEGYQRSEEIARYDPLDADDDGLATLNQWDTYFGPDKDRHSTEQELTQVRDQLEVHRFSLSALASAVLQQAKQALSIVHGRGLAGVPDGRPVGTQPLSAVIWHARNQCVHWEEGRLHNRTATVFAELARDFDPIFYQYNSQNLSFEVVQTLGWRSADAFYADLISLA